MNYFDIKTTKNVGKHYITNTGMVVCVVADTLPGKIEVENNDGNYIESYYYNRFDEITQFNTPDELAKHICGDNENAVKCLKNMLIEFSGPDQDDVRFTFRIDGVAWDIKLQYESCRFYYYTRKITEV